MSDQRGVLRVLHVFGRLECGGAELRTVELTESFDSERVRSDFLVLTGLDGPLDERVRSSGGHVIKCSLDWRFPASLYRLLRTRRYDVVHSHVHYFSGVILAIAWLAGTAGRIAHFRTAVVNDKPRSWHRAVQLAVCRYLIDRTATDILAVGRGTMSSAWSPDWQSDSRCRVVYSGFSPDRFHGVVSSSIGSPTIVSVASLQPVKNQVRLIEIFRRCSAEIRSLRLVLLGRDVDGYESVVRRAAANADISDRIDFLGQVDDPLPLIAGANLMILPSLWEGLPGAAVEACALGVPVLASDLPGTRELATYFPHLTVMSLDRDDGDWAAAAARLIQAGVTSGTSAATYFAHSPFTLAQSRESHFEIWSRARASA